jgi:hypothetical protein
MEHARPQHNSAARFTWVSQEAPISAVPFPRQPHCDDEAEILRRPELLFPLLPPDLSLVLADSLAERRRRQTAKRHQRPSRAGSLSIQR